MTTSNTPDMQGEAADAESDDPGQADATQAEGSADSAAPDAESATPPSPEQLLAEAEDRLLRTQAELQNTRRRARLDSDEALARGKRDVLLDVLPALDALQRALATAGDELDEQLLEGLRQTEQLFVSGLMRHGIEPVPADIGATLDPALHRALVQQPSADHEPGTIVAEITRGYRLGDLLLREAEVVVAAAPVTDGDG